MSSSIKKALQMGHEVRDVFDWPSPKALFDKIEEEVGELKESLGQTREHQIHEFGDVLFTLLQLARHLNIDPEESLDKTLVRWTNRFNLMKELIQKDGSTMSRLDNNALESYWQKAKEQLQDRP